MKTKINISIETKNVIPVFDSNNQLIIQMSQQLEQTIHSVIEQWINENLSEEHVTALINNNYYQHEVLSSIDNIEDICDLKIVYNEEILIDILRFIPPEEQINLQENKLIDLEDKVEVPPMEIDNGTEEEEDFEEYEDDEKEKETEDEPEENL